MFDIEKMDHIGIRVSDRAVSVAFHERLGFRTLTDTGFEQGHPVIMPFLAGHGIPLSGQFSFKDLRAVFIRDPDRNAIELDAYAGDEPETRAGEPEDAGYRAHP